MGIGTVIFAVLGSVVIVSLISFVGALTVSWKEDELAPFMFVLVSLAAGTLFGDVFIHLFPEAVQEGFTLGKSFWVLDGILVFFVVEKFIHWRHCHMPEHHKKMHAFAFMNLVGDGVHNFIDGMLIAGSYLVSLPIGFATTIAVVLHEIPQEIGDFGVLLQGGLSRRRALLLNFYSALTAVAGAVIVLIVQSAAKNFTEFLVPFTIGGFLYIAGSDLIPELHKETKPLNSLVQLLAFIVGIFIMYLLTFLG